MTPISEFNEFFNTEIPDNEYDTVGGFVINTFGYLPKRGEIIDFERFNIKILRADKRRVHLILFTQIDSGNLLKNNSK